jgi:RimJ/RimL family protein N-acetyltransferase
MADVIRTQRLVLRPLQASDADRVFALFNDWNVVRRLSSPPWPYTLEDARSFVRQQAANAQNLTKTTFAITRNDVLIGGIDVRAEPDSPSARGLVLGYWLGHDYWGEGYMTEAGRGFLAHVFAANIGDVILSGAFADNAASLRVQEKLGFTRNGERTMFAKPRGDRFPHIDTVLTRAQFEALAA